MRSFVATGMAGILLFVLAPATAGGSSAGVATVESLARNSDAVVRGTVVSRESRWSGDGKRIFTFVTVKVESVWAGDTPAEVTIRTPGGEVGDIGQLVEGAAVFSEEEEMVVFLEHYGANPKAFQVKGLAQGKFRIEQGEARPQTGGIHFTRSEVRAGERRAEPMSVDELEQRVRAAR